MIQTSKEKTWLDESNNQIPYSRVTNLEKLKEKNLAVILKDALLANKKLVDLKETVTTLFDEIFEAHIAENGKITTKGNFTVFSFDRSIKLEVAINERIEFDDLTIKSAKQKINEYLDQNIAASDDFAKAIAIDAFSTTKGKLDPKKVLSLLKWKPKVKHESFQQGCELIEKSIRRPSSKTYHRVYVRNNEGGYDAVELNFSSI